MRADREATLAVLILAAAIAAVIIAATPVAPDPIETVPAARAATVLYPESPSPLSTPPTASLAREGSTETAEPVVRLTETRRELIRGKATWYRVPGRVAAAGSELRRAIGKGWRYDFVDVCRRGVTWQTCVSVQLVDTCGCAGRRIIDLSRRAFRGLANPDRGVIRVTVAYTPRHE